MTPTLISICASICEGRPLLRRLLEGACLHPPLTLGRAVVGIRSTRLRPPPPRVKRPLILSTVVVRTIRVDPATFPTVMSEVRACSN